MSRRWEPTIYLNTLAIFLTWGVACAAQDALPRAPLPGGGVDQIGNLKAPEEGFNGFDGLSGKATVYLSAELKLDERRKERGKLIVRAEMDEGYHIYSLTQKPGGPQKSVLEVGSSVNWELAGPFTATTPPHVVQYPDSWENLDVEEHHDNAVWEAPIRVTPGADPNALTGEVQLRGQLCKNSCQNFDTTSPVKFSGTYASRPSGVYQSPLANLQLEGRIEPPQVKPGDHVRLHLRATPKSGWHVYQQSNTNVEGFVGKQTMISLTEGMGWPAKLDASAKPTAKGYHEGPVVWTIDLEVPAAMSNGIYTLRGLIGFQTCDESNCLPPTGASFTAEIEVGDVRGGEPAPMAFSSASYSDAEKSAKTFAWAADSPSAGPTKQITLLSFLGYIGAGLLGGLILNGMPCVLPVIALKVLSFVDQAGKDRWAVLRTNLVYSAGILFIFVILAVLAAFFTMMWGQQMQSPTFLIGLTVLVFALALSLLGVWELPIPGFAMANTSQKLQEKEGLGGTFFKGIFTTIIAVPCSGPFLGTAFGKMMGAPVWMILTFYTSIGVGMASPYILIGIFPSLIKWLPKPGQWMELFKQVMGFVLIFTSIYQLSLVPNEYHFAVLVLLGGVAFACWCFGKVPFGASIQTRVRLWAPALTVLALASWFGFTNLVAETTPGEGAQAAVKHKYIDWEPYTIAGLDRATSAGKTVMVEFTAEWCLTCRTNMKLAIETPEVKQKLDELGAVSMLADWTRASKEIETSLRKLERASIPVLAIYPAGDRENPIILTDVITKSQLLSALEQAGPSRQTVAQASNDGPDHMNE